MQFPQWINKVVLYLEGDKRSVHAHLRVSEQQPHLSPDHMAEKVHCYIIRFMADYAVSAMD